VADLRGIMSLRGRHNWQNACAAFAAARAMGVAPDAIADGMKTFPGLAHRMEVIGRRGNVIFVNDSKATNADAAGHALAAFGRIYWIAGGRAKFGGIEQLAPLFTHIAGAYLIGEAARDFAATLGDTVPVAMCDTLDKAVARAADDASRDGADEVVVLLSPACASFDQFADFEIRGDAFRTAVKALARVHDMTGEAA
jgi:UDP-N-acetylmuramoylalanine--D-glutamate ligase